MLKLGKPPILKPDVFILETLNKEDERERRFEGRALAELLHMSGKNPKYHYFQDVGELPHLVGLFCQSKYRFLHFSSHGSFDKIFTTNGEMTYVEFAKIFKRSLPLKRAFFSACEVGNDLFSEVLAGSNAGVQSIVAPVQKIRFDHAAVIWGALYVSLFTENDETMKHDQIKDRLVSLRHLFPVDFHFSGYHPNKANKWAHTIISKQNKPANIPVPTIPIVPAILIAPAPASLSPSNT